MGRTADRWLEAVPAARDWSRIRRAWQDGTAPRLEALRGDYRVTAPCFPWISLEVLGHCKRIGEGGAGVNRAAGIGEFGRFNLKMESGRLLIDYDVPGASSAMRRIVDRIRIAPDGRLIGRLFLRLAGKERFLLYFEMIPEGNSVQ